MASRCRWCCDDPDVHAHGRRPHYLVHQDQSDGDRQERGVSRRHDRGGRGVRRRVAADAATPTIRLAIEMMPSLAPSTAARNHPVRPTRWFSGRTRGRLMSFSWSHLCASQQPPRVLKQRHCYGMRRKAGGPAVPLLEVLGPAIELAFRLLLGVAVTFLKQAEQLVALAFDDMEIVIRQ